MWILNPSPTPKASTSTRTCDADDGASGNDISTCGSARRLLNVCVYTFASADAGVASEIFRTKFMLPTSTAMFLIERGRSCVLTFRNESGFWHPMHLHGHAFRVLSRGGVAMPRPEWRDTVLVAPRETIQIAFVADNPGDWMLHCHVLEHQAGGMMAAIRVA